MAYSFLTAKNIKIYDEAVFVFLLSYWNKFLKFLDPANLFALHITQADNQMLENEYLEIYSIVFLIVFIVILKPEKCNHL